MHLGHRLPKEMLGFSLEDRLQGDGLFFSHLEMSQFADGYLVAHPTARKSVITPVISVD